MLSVDKWLSDQNAVGIGRKGTIDSPQLLKAPFWTVDTLFYLTPSPGFALFFIYSFCQLVNWKQLDESTGVPSLSKKTIEGIKINIPCKTEQQKIGIIIAKIDSLIVANQRQQKCSKIIGNYDTS